MFLTYLKFEIKPVYINVGANVMRKGQQIKTHLHNVDQTCYLVQTYLRCVKTHLHFILIL